MDAMKSATATGKERVQNMVAKADLKIEANKAAATEKAERRAASGKAEKHDAKAKRHTKEAELVRGYKRKRAENLFEKKQKLAALSQKESAKHPGKASSGASANEAPIESIGAAGGEDLLADNEPISVEAPVPMHGSGVPTHSTLHHEPHDLETTKTMDGARHTGSYMV